MESEHTLVMEEWNFPYRWPVILRMGWSSLQNDLQTQCKMKMWTLARAGEIIIPFPWPIAPDLVDRPMLRDCKLCNSQNWTANLQPPASHSQ